MANSNVANKQVNTDITVKQAIENIDKRKADLGQFGDLSVSKAGGGKSIDGTTLNVFDPVKAETIDWPFLASCCYWGYVAYCLENDLEVGKAKVSDKDIQAMCVIETRPQTNTSGDVLENKFVYTYKNLKTGAVKEAVQPVKFHLTASNYMARLNLVLKRS